MNPFSLFSIGRRHCSSHLNRWFVVAKLTAGMQPDIKTAPVKDIAGAARFPGIARRLQVERECFRAGE